MIDFALGLMALLGALAFPVLAAGFGFLFFALGLDILGMEDVFRSWFLGKLMRSRKKGDPADE